MRPPAAPSVRSARFRAMSDSGWFERERGTALRYAPKQPGFIGDVADGLVLWLGFQL